MVIFKSFFALPEKKGQVWVSLFVSKRRTELLSKEYKTATLVTSNKRKETNNNKTHTDEDKTKNNPENNAGSSLEPV